MGVVHTGGCSIQLGESFEGGQKKAALREVPLPGGRFSTGNVPRSCVLAGHIRGHAVGASA